MLGGDRDVVLGEVAGVGEQRRVGGQLGVDRGEVVGELVERRLELAAVGGLSDSSAATITCATESTIAWPLKHW